MSIKSYFFSEIDRSSSKILTRLFVYNTVCLISCFVLLISLGQTINSISIKEQAYNYQFNDTLKINLSGISTPKDAVTYFKSFKIKIPLSDYLLFALALLCWFYWIDYEIYLVNKIRRLTNGRDSL